jgi:hypothetical protein
MTDEEITGAPSVRVVLMRRDTDGEVTPLSANESDDLLDSAVVMVAPVDVPAEVVRALLETPVPVAFSGNPWLNEHRELVFTDNQCVVGGHVLRYHDKFGVYTSEET